MRKKLIATIGLILILSVMGLAGCGSEKQEPGEAQIIEVQRGDLIVGITADGNLDMPHEVELRFGTPGTVKKIFVAKGDKVKEGTLLAKLDDTVHKLAIAAAQYDVELAMNNIAGKIHPALLGYPSYYPDTSTVLYVEQAQKELEQARELMEQNSYHEAAVKLRMAQHDLASSRYLLNVPAELPLSVEYDELGIIATDKYPTLTRAIGFVERDLESITSAQELIEQGNYGAALTKLDAIQLKLQETHRLVKSISGRIRVSQRAFACCSGGSNPGSGAASLLLSYPDTSTSLDLLRQVEEELQSIQDLMERGDYDEYELAEALRTAQHDIDMSKMILKDNELIFRNGVPLQEMRAYNLQLQGARIALQNAKEDLMKTEILAPFDGTVVNIDVKENDQLSSFDYSSRTAVHMVDTSTVEMDGVVDEIDIFQVKVGQEAIIIVDALPGEELKGAITFISPFGTSETGTIEYAVTISLDPTELELRGGLTASADIVVEKNENVLLVPNKAIESSSGDHWVKVVIDETTGETEERKVVVGAQNGQFYQIISGVEQGEKVVVEGRSRR